MNFPEKLKPYKGIIFFVVALLAANYFWKFTVSGDEDGSNQVLFLGLNISQPFILLASNVAKVSHTLLDFIGFHATLYPNNVIRYENHHSVWIVWACTGLKQTFIFTVILFFARGSWKNKLWFILLGWGLIYIINVLRITAIAAIVRNHPEQFELYHEHLLKYLFYILIFFIWVFWEEKIAGKEEIKESNKQDE